MGVLAKKKIHPTSNEDEEQIRANNQTVVSQEQANSRISQIHQLNRSILNKQDSQTDSQFNSTKRNRTFIIRKAFQTGLNQLSSTIKKPVNHNRLTKLDSNNVELIQNRFRKNGWSPPIHPLQIAAYFVFILMTGLLFVYFLPMINLEDEKLVYLMYAICILITTLHLVLHTIAISINPADDNVIAKQRNQPNKSLPIFDRTQHSHVIENQFCYICEVPISVNSKHCSRCNVCIQDFDHHCDWLNTCVGSKNYKLFISSVISALIGSSIILALSILFIMCWAKSNCVWFDNPYLNGLDLDSDDQAFDNQSSIDLTRLSAQPNLTTPISLISNSTIELNNFITAINSTDNDNINENFTDSFNSTDEEDAFDGNSLQIQTIIHLSILFISLILSSITVILLLHLLCFHIFLNCIGLSTYKFIVQRREAAERNLNQESSVNRPSINERILRCLSCQSDFCSKWLPKSQATQLETTSQSIIEKNNHVNLIKKRQLSQQMSNESRMSRNSRESGNYSSRTVSLYEDFALDKNDNTIERLNTTKINLPSNENDSTQVYLGSPQRQQKRVLEEWKTLNNRNLTSDKESGMGESYFENHLKKSNQTEKVHNQLKEVHNQTNLNYAPATTIDKHDNDLNKLAELNANNLLISEKLEQLNLDKKARTLQDDLSRSDLNQNDLNKTDHRNESIKKNQTIEQSSKNEQQFTQNNEKVNETVNRYIEDLSEFLNQQQLNDESSDQRVKHKNHIKFKNID